MSKNAEGWVRHRGGKCPVEIGAIVDIRNRDGRVFEGVLASNENCWVHRESPSLSDVMAYRLHKPAEQVESCSKPDPRDSAKRDSDYVCWMRDRITEIDATAHALTSERAELVQKLASEGFALIGRINELLTDAAQKHEDMGDWRNWKTGDLIEMVNQKHWADMTDGNTYALTKAGGKGFSFVDDIGDMREAFERVANDYAKDFKWHSRPSA